MNRHRLLNLKIESAQKDGTLDKCLRKRHLKDSAQNAKQYSNEATLTIGKLIRFDPQTSPRRRID